jgi:hypothetical protein
MKSDESRTQIIALGHSKAPAAGDLDRFFSKARKRTPVPAKKIPNAKPKQSSSPSRFKSLTMAPGEQHKPPATACMQN